KRVAFCKFSPPLFRSAAVVEGPRLRWGVPCLVGSARRRRERANGVMMGEVSTIPRRTLAGLRCARAQFFLPRIVIVSVNLPVPAAFVAPTVTLVVPAVAGAPLISPVLLFSIRPAGSAAAL